MIERFVGASGTNMTIENGIGADGKLSPEAFEVTTDRLCCPTPNVGNSVLHTNGDTIPAHTATTTNLGTSETIE
jgi:hypothetical protein